MFTVYGSKISYYTGKLEAYLRYKGLPYERVPPHSHRREILRNTGAMQLPIVLREDGRWMSDTTPIILQLECEEPTPSILPENPVVLFIARLLEDYADEWLWRSAMHYRWSFPHDRELLSGIIADEIMGDLPLPRFMKRRLITWRQYRGFVRGDGVRPHTRQHVEAGYLAALDHMSRMLERRPFLLGDAPSLADFGFMGPMLRHFGHDPTPADIMRDRSPRVYAWVARVWNAQPERRSPPSPRFLETIPSDAAPMLREVCETHLEQLSSNVIAYALGPKRFQMTIQNCHYSGMPISRYRVACLERLRTNFDELGADDQQTLRSLLPYPQAKILWQANPAAASGYDEELQAPFGKAINVYDRGVPR
jgi:glutathione S-transferase